MHVLQIHWTEQSSCCKVTDFGIGDLKELNVVVVGMPGSGAKSLVTCWTGAAEIQPKLGAEDHLLT